MDTDAHIAIKAIDDNTKFDDFCYKEGFRFGYCAAKVIFNQSFTEEENAPIDKKIRNNAEPTQNGIKDGFYKGINEFSQMKQNIEGEVK